jgi:ADP-heptose:LPS heptosyltransferase
MKVEQLGEEIVNNPDGFREVAAVMANLDLLVTSDTGPAHLAGALGRPIWVALARRPDWRWGNESTTSPWYPTMRLFRQRTSGDWPGVFEAIAEELRAMVAART